MSEASSTARSPLLELQLEPSHPRPPCPWKNCLPRNRSLVLKRLGTTDLGDYCSRGARRHLQSPRTGRPMDIIPLVMSVPSHSELPFSLGPESLLGCLQIPPFWSYMCCWEILMLAWRKSERGTGWMLGIWKPG